MIFPIFLPFSNSDNASEFQVDFFWKYFCNSVKLIYLVECAFSSDSRSPLVNKHYLIECASHDSWNALLHIYYLVECAFVECALFLERFMRTQRGLAVVLFFFQLRKSWEVEDSHDLIAITRTLSKS